MKKKKRKHPYYRTAALLNTQQQVYTRGRRARHTVPWKLIVLLVLVGSGIMWLLLDDRWYLMGEDIQIVGTGSTATAREVAIASDLLGWHGLRLRPRAAETLIVEKITTVTEAHVECGRFPASCAIQVTERTPSLNWVTEAGTSYWVDATGILIPAQDVRAGLPVVRGPLPNTENAQALAPVLQGVQALAALGVATDALEYHPQRGLIWTDPQGRRIAFGVGSEMQARWKIYEALIAHLDARNVFPWTIDVRFPEGPTYSLERLW